MKLIRPLVMQHQVCQWCQHGYTSYSPLVSLNCCLTCFLQKHPDLRYISPLPDWGRFVFLDRRNFVHHSHTAEAGMISSVFLTLNYWDYPRPDQVIEGGNPITLSDDSWKMAGRPGASVVVLIWKQYADSKPYAFLSWRSGDYERIDRHKRATGDLPE